MMRRYGGGKDRLKLPTRKTGENELPECRAIIATHAELPEDLAQHDQAAANIAWGISLPAERATQAMRQRLAHLIFVALEKPLGFIGPFHALLPHGDDVVIGHEESYVRFTLVTVVKPIDFL